MSTSNHCSGRPQDCASCRSRRPENPAWASTSSPAVVMCGCVDEVRVVGGSMRAAYRRWLRTQGSRVECLHNATIERDNRRTTGAPDEHDHRTPPPTRTVDGIEVPAAGTYALDASHSHVGFSVRHVMVSSTKGRFADVERHHRHRRGPAGVLRRGQDPAARRSTPGTRTATGTCARPTSSTSRSTPTLTYRSRAVQPAGKGRWTVEGDLTVRGVTRPVPLEVSLRGRRQGPLGRRAHRLHRHAPSSTGRPSA